MKLSARAGTLRNVLSALPGRPFATYFATMFLWTSVN